MAEDVSHLLARWLTAGVIDDETAGRIADFERGHGGEHRLRWPIWVAVFFGVVLLGAGLLLFVAANWEAMSPGARFALALLIVGVLHVAGALLGSRFAALGTALHLTGTIALGAAVFVAGQVFNLDEHWPRGVMLWALGAAIGWWLLADAYQLTLLAILAPAWLASEWLLATSFHPDPTSGRVLAVGVLLLAVAYFTASAPAPESIQRRYLIRLGMVLLPLTAAYLAFSAGDTFFSAPSAGGMSPGLRAIGWGTAIAGPLLIAVALRRWRAWQNAVAALWTLVAVQLAHGRGDVALFAWWALGATGLVAWGVAELRSERINMGAALFAATVAAFYFSAVMDKLGRSASLVGLGLLCLGGGWALERLRRRLVAGARASGDPR